MFVTIDAAIAQGEARWEAQALYQICHKMNLGGVWEREWRYAKLGWLITDIMLRAWDWACNLVPKRFRGQ